MCIYVLYKGCTLCPSWDNSSKDSVIQDHKDKIESERLLSLFDTAQTAGFLSFLKVVDVLIIIVIIIVIVIIIIVVIIIIIIIINIVVFILQN